MGSTEIAAKLSNLEVDEEAYKMRLNFKLGLRGRPSCVRGRGRSSKEMIATLRKTCGESSVPPGAPPGVTEAVPRGAVSGHDTTDSSIPKGEILGVSTEDISNGKLCNSLYQKYGGRGRRDGVAIHEKVPQRYIPEPALEGDKLFVDRKNKNYRTGINFDDYEKIPVEVHGEDVPRLYVECFEDLRLDPIILENVYRAGYMKPTPIQKAAIPCILGRKDLMACAQTGSGKSAAYLLPIINDLMCADWKSRKDIECLVLVPTRELAAQIQREANLYSHNTNLTSIYATGGAYFPHQKRLLLKGANILIATPGRLLQHVYDGLVSLSKLKYFVVDEADRMFDMGFMGQVRQIVRRLTPKSQRVNVMFSATFPTQIQKAAGDFLRDYAFIAVGTVGGACRDIQQEIHFVDRADKRMKLMEILRDIDHKEKILIFCSRKANTKVLAEHLLAQNFSSTTISSDKLQMERDLALKEFLTGDQQILVATDVAARGLDIPKVAMVINYDLPNTIDEYVQRIGRTGRVGHMGKAISFFEEGIDDHIRNKLVRVLQDAEQVVPDWLLDDSLDDSIYRRRAMPTDWRRVNV